MKALIITILIIAAIVTYIIFTHRAINIMNKVGCEGSFLEWLICLLPIIHLIVYFKYPKVCKFNTLKSQFIEMKEKFKYYEENGRRKY